MAFHHRRIAVLGLSHSCVYLLHGVQLQNWKIHNLFSKQCQVAKTWCGRFIWVKNCWDTKGDFQKVGKVVTGDGSVNIHKIYSRTPDACQKMRKDLIYQQFDSDQKVSAACSVIVNPRVKMLWIAVVYQNRQNILQEYLIQAVNRQFGYRSGGPEEEEPEHARILKN